MTYHDQIAGQRGAECADADERPVHLEPLDCLPGQALGTGQGRETDESDSPMSRLRSTRTENLSRHSREPETTAGHRGERVGIDVASRPVGSDPPSVCARPEDILSRQAIEENHVQDDEESGDDKHPLPFRGGDSRGGDVPLDIVVTENYAELEGGGDAEPRDDASANFPTPTPPLKGRGLERPTTRHDGWTPEIRVKFLNALANCGNVASAALFVQRSRTSAYALKRRDADFATAWDAALLLARDVATDTLQDRAINGVEEDVMYHGEVVATRRRYDSRLLLAHIARLDKLAEDLSTSRAAARFEDVTQVIAAKKDVTPLITEPTEAEKREQARGLAALGIPAEEDPEHREPEAPFECTYKDDPPEIYMMTQGEADALAAEVAGLTVRAVDGADAVTAMAAAKDVPEEGLEADHAGPEEKEQDPVHIVNFGEEEERN